MDEATDIGSIEPGKYPDDGEMIQMTLSSRPGGMRTNMLQVSVDKTFSFCEIFIP